MGDRPKLMEDPNGMVFEYLDEQETEFLYEEVFVRRSYLQHGLVVQDGAVVVDAGANVGLFSLQCLQEAKGVQVYAFEPIPALYEVLVKNLHSVKPVIAGVCPKPVVLRVALGAEQDQQLFTYFDTDPGESTRHPKEREEQRRTLQADAGAKSWREAMVTAGEVEDETSITKARDRGAVARTPKTDTDLGECDQQRVLGEGESLLQRPVQDSMLIERPVGKRGSEPGDGEEVGHEAEDKKRCGVHNTENHSEGEGSRGGQSVLCNVVPLSLALHQLGIAAVDLLKVDVEGDELAVLQGISSNDWPNIRQVTVEVHDVDGRLATIVDLLRSATVGFNEVCWEAQTTSEVDGYVMVVPTALRMFLVFAKRRPSSGELSEVTGTASTAAIRDDRYHTAKRADSEVKGVSVVEAGKQTREDRGRDIRNNLSTFCYCNTAR